MAEHERDVPWASESSGDTIDFGPEGNAWVNLTANIQEIVEACQSFADLEEVVADAVASLSPQATRVFTQGAYLFWFRSDNALMEYREAFRLLYWTEGM